MDSVRIDNKITARAETQIFGKIERFGLSAIRLEREYGIGLRGDL
jgi:hypothetical protein